MVVVDPAFGSVPKGTACFLIWRVEKMKLVAVPKEAYGTFYEGDSYLILHVKEGKGALEQHVHFWLGQDSSKDEYTTAAIKAVELDDYLGGAPVQYRETQGNESKLFLSYFKSKGINYKKGGVKTGLNHVEEEVVERLMHCKGKNNVRVREIDIGWQHMNNGDAYILDITQILFVWCGQKCNLYERRKAMEFAQKKRSERGKGNLVVVEDGKEADELGAEELQLFEEFLPLSQKGHMLSAEQAQADEAFEKVKQQLKLWRVSEEANQLKLTEVAEAPLEKKMLDHNDCFIVDHGTEGIFVWVGRGASKKERSESMKNAEDFTRERGYPDSVGVIRVIDQGEPTEFKALFKVWEKEKVPGSVKPARGRVAQVVQTKFDASTMHENPKLASETKMPDDGSGSKKIWRVERVGNTYEKVDLDKKFHGQLFGGDCYIILYTYLLHNREQHIIYFWIGRKSTQDEQAACALRVIELDDEMGGMPVQVRVEQGREPKHFMAIFEGKLIIFEGGKAGNTQTSDEGPGDTYMLQVRGTSKYNTKAVQVACRAEALNSNDMFVIFTKTAVYIWNGKGATGDEREMAKQVASISPRQANMIIEGQEKEDFWQILGGKAPYSSTKILQEEEEEHAARLFQMSNASGVFRAEEVCDFIQDDLCPADLALLDAWDMIYLWVGNESRKDEREQADVAAIEYLEMDPSGRQGTSIVKVHQGYEPPDFVGFFGAWDRDLWSKGKSFAELKQEMAEKNIDMQTVTKKAHDHEASYVKFPYEVLKQKEGLPEEVDLERREKHLTDEEFQQVFGMSAVDFASLPTWKQTNLKKAKGLF